MPTMTRLAYRLWRWRGWQFQGEFPALGKFIAVGAPHTTNWDFVLFLAALHAYRLKVSFIGKHTLFRWPFGWFFRAFGGIPVDRGRPGGVVAQVAEAFHTADEMILVMAPEGTRSSAPHWKTGFLKIAEAAQVPIVLVGLDSATRQVNVGPVIESVGDVGSVMDRIREFYADKHGLRPAFKGPVVLADEATS